MFKRCSECSAVKSISEFHKQKGSKDGLRSHCKECRIESGKVYRAKPGQLKKAAARMRRWRQTEKGKYGTREYRSIYAKTERAKILHRKYSNNHRIKYPERIISRKRLWWAVETERILRPSVCQICLTKCKPHGHHHLGHKEEHWLDVIWLCRPCHTNEHSKNV